MLIIKCCLKLKQSQFFFKQKIIDKGPFLNFRYNNVMCELLYFLFFKYFLLEAIVHDILLKIKYGHLSYWEFKTLFTARLGHGPKSPFGIS